uniref:Uncharacterized protein n=1 Tax=Anguilla anguilla TaxID=7936 RepID=A0A0E9S3R7_ANGAN
MSQTQRSRKKLSEPPSWTKYFSNW